MTWVKVCGLSTTDDVAAAVAAGADAVGFVNVPGSPRYVSLDEAARLAAGVPATTVLLTVDRNPEEIVEILGSTDLNGVQPYGADQLAVAQAAADAGHFVLLPLHARPRLNITDLPGVPLLDTPSTDKLGGTGEVFDWGLLAGVEGDFVLAGGLGPDNVVEAISTVRPWGVDASSSLERSPGRKDHSMVADFIKKAKES